MYLEPPCDEEPEAEPDEEEQMLGVDINTTENHEGKHFVQNI